MSIKYRLLLFLGIFILMIIPKNVFAYSTENWWTKDFDNVAVNYYGCSGSSVSTCTNSISVGGSNLNMVEASGTHENFYQVPNYFVRNTSFDTAGHMWSVLLNQRLNSNYVYNVQFYVCSNKSNFTSAGYDNGITAGTGWTDTTRSTLLSNMSGTISTIYDVDDTLGLRYCRIITSNITGTNSPRYVQLRLTNNTTTSGYTESLIGVKVEPLGLYDNYVKNQIDNAKDSIQNNINSANASINSNINSASNNIKNSINGTIQSAETNITTEQGKTTDAVKDVNETQKQTNQKLDNVNNTLNSDEGVANNDVSNKANEWSSKLAGTGPVSNMVLMPITLLNGYVSGLNATCTEYNLGSLMGTEIKLPCINISNYLGASLWNVIDVLFSGFMIYAIGKKFVKIFNDFTNLRDNQMDELYGGGK